MNIPTHVLTAAVGLLEPYGVNLERLLKNAKQQMSENRKGVKFLTVRQVEQNYGIRRWTIWRLIKSGQIKSVKLSTARSGKVLISIQSLENYFTKKERA